MKLIRLERDEDKKVKVIIDVGGDKADPAGGITPDVQQFNAIIFKNKEDALKFFTTINIANEKVVQDNIGRLSQMPVDSLEKINDFADAINRHKALGSNKSKKIEDLIGAFNNMRTLERNVEQARIDISRITDIVEALRKLK